MCNCCKIGCLGDNICQCCLGLCDCLCHRGDKMDYIKLLREFIKEYDKDNSRPLSELDHKVLYLFALWLVEKENNCD